MSIEKLLEDNTAAMTALTAALNANTKVLSGGKAGGSTPATGTGTKAPKYTIAQLTAKAVELKEASDANTVKAIVKKTAKVDSVKVVPPAAIDITYAALSAKLAEIAEGEDGGDETASDDDV